MIQAIKQTYTILKYFTSDRIVLCLGVVSLIVLLYFCASPTEPGWSQIDIFFNHAILMILAMGIIGCLISKAYLKFTVIDCLVCLLYSYFMARFYFDATYPAKGISLHTTYAFALYVALRILFTGTKINVHAIAILILSFALYEAAYGINQIVAGASRHNLYLVTGTFNNPGPYSACLVMGLAIICTYLENPTQFISKRISVKFRNTVEIILQGAAIIFASIIILTLSRTAFIATALCLLIIFRKRLGRWIWLLIGMLLAIGVCLYFIKSGSADGRLAIDQVAMHAISERPVFGHGVGRFFHTFAETTENLFLNGTTIDLSAIDVIEYAFNDWLHIGVELGAIGFLMTAAIAMITLLNLWKKSFTLFLVFCIILIFSLFSYPLELLPYRIIAIMILAFIAPRSRLPFKYKTSQVLSISIMALSTIAIAICLIKEDNKVKAFVNAERDYNMLGGITDPAFIKDFNILLPYLQDNRYFLFEYAQMLALAGRYNDSNEMLRRGALISNDPMFLVLQGNNYREMGAYDLAEEAYLKAWHRMPNRIYPLFRLMKLHEQLGNPEKAKDYAGQIIDFKEKIPSPAVNEIKEESRKIYEYEI